MTSNIRSNTRRVRTVLREIVKTVTDSREQWVKLEILLMRTLRMFPDAREAVVAAIREVLGADYRIYQPEPGT